MTIKHQPASTSEKIVTGILINGVPLEEWKLLTDSQKELVRKALA